MDAKWLLVLHNNLVVIQKADRQEAPILLVSLSKTAEELGPVIVPYEQSRTFRYIKAAKGQAYASRSGTVNG